MLAEELDDDSAAPSSQPMREKEEEEASSDVLTKLIVVNDGGMLLSGFHSAIFPSELGRLQDELFRGSSSKSRFPSCSWTWWSMPYYAGVQVVKLPVVGKRQFPMIFETTHILQLLDTLINVPVVQVVQLPGSFTGLCRGRFPWSRLLVGPKSFPSSSSTR